MFTPQPSNNQTPRGELLSPWNQAAPRVYIITVTLCFPFDNSKSEAASELLESSLRQLAQDRPIFAARIEAVADNPAFLQLRQASEYNIPFKSGTLEGSYSKVKAEEFPQDQFVGPLFSLPRAIGENSYALPVLKVAALFMDRGLILVFNLSHAVFYAECMRTFIECFAAQTRSATIELPSEQTFPLHNTHQTDCDFATFERLIADCPEYAILPNKSGPTQPLHLENGTPLEQIETTGKIFVFTNERIRELQESMIGQLKDSSSLSTYTCLSGLTVKHVIKARMETEDFLPHEKNISDETFLHQAVTWKNRAFRELNGSYLGNTAVPAVARVPVSTILDQSYEAAQLASQIKAAIKRVDEETIRRRL